MARLASAALLATTLTALPATATAAASAGYTPEQVCGSGFGRVNGGTQPATDHKGIIQGYVYLLYNARTGENCVVTIKSNFVGQPTLTRATLFRQIIGQNPDKFEDEGAYKYYAGPVKAQAKGRCVIFHGLITNMRAGERSSASSIQAFGGSRDYGNCG
ncbi:hypothetical protein AB0B45_13830 [Nonomuraea sp. NPDC049152]|uniref:hypothetical protein n=1 Tax=Nonomuraea sp. NPDC049152 TaxID=3154350 RepID=UPI00340E3DCE